MYYLPNIITFLRILIALALPFIADNLFLPLYLFTGMTDFLDGWLARKMNWTTPLGAWLDSVADHIFFASVAVKVIEIFKVPLFILKGALLILLIRCLSYVIGYFRFHQFTSLHTYLNKLTGGLLFISPIILFFLPIHLLGSLLLFVATLSAFEELLIVLTFPKIDRNVPTFFKRK